MNFIARLFRRPVLTLVWLAALTAASLLLSIGGEVFYSVAGLRARMDQEFTATALVNQNQNIYDGQALTDEELKLLTQMEQVSFLDRRALTGGYSPAWTSLLSAQSERDYRNTLDKPYNFVMLTGTVNGISEETREDSLSLNDTNYLYTSTHLQAALTVEEVLSAHPGYTVPETINIEFYWVDPPEELQLVEGERYILYGQYFASDRLYDPLAGVEGVERYEILPDGSKRELTEAVPSLSIGLALPTSAVLLNDDGTQSFYTWADFDPPIPLFAPLEGSVEDFLAHPDNQLWQSTLESMDVTQHSLPLLGTQRLESLYHFNRGSAYLSQGRDFTAQEYARGDQVCIISEAVARSCGLQVGDTVPISQYDPLRYYEDMTNLPPGPPRWGYSPQFDQHITTAGSEYFLYNNPFLRPFAPGQDFATHDELFTVVGIYRQENWWDYSDAHAFTPNTVFVPQGALASCAFEGDMGGVYFSAILKNGTAEQFRQALKGTELEGRFLAFDQNYESVSAGVDALTSSAAVLMAISLAGWLAVAVIFLFLRQNRERLTLGVMRSVGAGKGAALGYLFSSGTALAAVGVLLGTLLSRAVTGGVMDAVLSSCVEQAQATALSSGVTLEAQFITQQLLESGMNMPALLLFALLQLLLMAAILFVHALILSRKGPRKLLAAG